MTWSYVRGEDKAAMAGRPCERTSHDPKTGKAVRCSAVSTEFVKLDSGRQLALCEACRRDLCGASPKERKNARAAFDARQTFLLAPSVMAPTREKVKRPAKRKPTAAQ